MSVRISVESLSGCAWNGCPSQRGIRTLVERVSAVTDKTTLYADPELRGFYLIVSKSKKGFYVQSLVNGKQVRVKLGDHPSLTANPP